MRGIEDKTVIVTGGASGLGRATALRFGEEGANVVVADTDDECGEETVDMIEEDGGAKAFFVHADMTSESDVESMVEETVETFGQLDFAYNNAGIGSPHGTITEIEASDWDEVYNVNLRGVALCLKHEIPRMLENEGEQKGGIVNTSSVSGLGGDVHMTPYNATKHGVVGLTRSACLEYSPEGIRINAVCPGVINTEGVREVQEETPEVVEKWTIGRPMPRLGEPEEIASTVVWLCSDDASFVTGQPIAVDGGITALH